MWNKITSEIILEIIIISVSGVVYMWTKMPE